MMQRLRGMKEHEGFTLIELLIVIVILGILAAIVVFAVGGITDQGTKSACKSDLKNTEVAVEAFRAQSGAYPNGADSDARFADIIPGFLREQPNSPDYTITIDDNAGTVSAAPACDTL